MIYIIVTDDSYTYSFGKEIERQKFDLKSGKAWRITYVNEDFRYVDCGCQRMLNVIAKGD